MSDFEEASKIAEFNDTAKQLAMEFWPGQLTLILKRKEPSIIPLEVSAHQDTLGLRIPENTIILEILRILKEKGYFGGIIGTSANYWGESPSISGDEVAKKLLSPIDLIIDGGRLKSKIPTTIIDCTSQELKFLRIGKISKEEINDYLANFQKK